MGGEENSENCSLRAQSIKRQPLGQKKKRKEKKRKRYCKDQNVSKSQFCLIMLF